MFTGLIFELGDIVSLERRGNSARLFLDAKALSQEAKLGDSIAINGTCLTIVEIRGTTLAFDISDETLKSTNLGELKVRDRVNLEPALRLSDRLGGHFVTGHIDGVGTLLERDDCHELRDVLPHADNVGHACHLKIAPDSGGAKR